MEKWKKNVRDENQRKEEAFKNKLPAELRQSEVKINTTVTAFKFGALGYETLGKVELAIIREGPLLMFRKLVQELPGRGECERGP